MDDSPFNVKSISNVSSDTQREISKRLRNDRKFKMVGYPRGATVETNEFLRDLYTLIQLTLPPETPECDECDCESCTKPKPMYKTETAAIKAAVHFFAMYMKE